MANRLHKFERRNEKMAQTRAKKLETKLAILLQAKTGRSYEMRRQDHPEFSLFSSTGARKYLSTAERRRFQRAVANLDTCKRLFCEVLFWSGGRVSEALALTPAAVDADNGSIALVTLKRRRRGVVRQIPLPRPVI